ncbi:MAG: glycosyltransferase family 1 protein [Alphaproteobacteria bacterium]
MRVLIVTDAWFPQINGVVRTLDAIGRELEKAGHTILLITPDQFRSIPCPTYSEIRLSLLPGRKIARIIGSFAPEAIHIATEGPLGLAARRVCRRRDLAFTTSFHTKFPEYVHARFGIPIRLSYRFLHWFHSTASQTMVATPSVGEELAGWGFENLVPWTRGVDVEIFHPRPECRETAFLPLERPLFLYTGRVAVEKNITAFLELDLPGTKMVVGDGPQLETLRRAYPDVHFAGAKHGEELARHYAAANVFVFPSLTDTFGNVLLEAMASGVPVAAYPVTGPRDVLAEHRSDDPAPGILDDDLGRAALAALDIPGEVARAYALRFTWARSAAQFLANLTPTRPQSAGDHATAAAFS